MQNVISKRGYKDLKKNRNIIQKQKHRKTPPSSNKTKIMNPPMPSAPETWKASEPRKQDTAPAP
jgi:hypothetical protein